MSSFARFIVVSFVLCCICLAEVCGQASIEIPDQTSESGFTLSVPVQLDGNLAIAGLQFELHYNSEQLALGEPSLNEALNDLTLISKRLTAGQRRFIVYTDDLSVLPSSILINTPVSIVPGTTMSPLALSLVDVIASDGTGTAVEPITVQSGLIMIITGPPEFQNTPYIFSVSELTIPGTNVIGTITANSVGGSPTAYALSSGPFGIDIASGEISLESLLDFETTAVYNLMVTASEGASAANESVTINVLDGVETNLDKVRQLLAGPGGPFEGIFDPTIIGLSADPDGDDTPNIYELWWGMEPNVADFPPDILLKTIADNGMELGAAEVDVVAAIDDLLLIEAEASFDLGIYRPITVAGILSESNGMRRLEFRDTASLDSLVRWFFQFTASEAAMR